MDSLCSGFYKAEIKMWLRQALSGDWGRICSQTIQVVDRIIVAAGLKLPFLPGCQPGTDVPRGVHIPCHGAPSVFKPATSTLNPSHTLNLSDFSLPPKKTVISFLIDSIQLITNLSYICKILPCNIIMGIIHL